MSNENVISSNDLAQLRYTADKAKMTPGMFDQGVRLHLLLDVYEDRETAEEEQAEEIEKLEKERDNLKDNVTELRAAIVKIQKLTKGRPDGGQALERLGEIASLAAEALAD